MTFREFNPAHDFEHDELRAYRMGIACPEYYSVYNADGVEVGYLRLRHGQFTAQLVENGILKDLVYHAYPQGDGIFEPEEREFFIKEALDSIKVFVN